MDPIRPRPPSTPLDALIAKWRAEAEQHAKHGDCYRKGQGWGLKDCADELEAALGATSPAYYEGPIYEAIGRYAVKSARWIRHEHEHYAAVPVAFGANLESQGARFDALTKASELGSPARSSVSQTEKMPSGCLGNTATDNSERQSPVVAWQPIGAAPRGRYVLAYWQRFKCYAVVLKFRDEDAWTDEDGSNYAEPSHWMPLSAPPMGEATSPEQPGPVQPKQTQSDAEARSSVSPIWRVAKGDTGIGGSIVYRGTEVSEGLFTNETEWFNVGGKGNAQRVCDALNAAEARSSVSEPQFERCDVTGLTRMTNFAEVLRSSVSEPPPLDPLLAQAREFLQMIEDVPEFHLEDEQLTLGIGLLRKIVAAVSESPVSPASTVEGAAPTSTPLDALREAIGGIVAYVKYNGGVHYGDCPEDDTCDCEGKPINDGINNAIWTLERLAASPASALVNKEGE